ncbi:amino acid ABC transporter substrate-binding protein [Mycobacterium paraffinicum]|uniref:Amino acid ABC transporter substrate-binding protein n=1 Tax=Mycobacterium paraffinicum TaxID=53378 RepID=A0A1Q4I2K9_9MYCO|nr:ABC transporter substrate-binding protein [Mycobacterium paraffinicum]OJZ76096.1 amino acid ABC transporter substrate-binding protein [Mycobacterium paraffinicum]
MSSNAAGVEPIKIGFLTDYIAGSAAIDDKTIYTQPMELVFGKGFESGVIHRPIELVSRTVQGLPRGNVRAVIDAFGELVDEGCLAVIGPGISDNAIPLRPEIERRFRVPAISVCGSEEWLGKWTFVLPNGSMTDEPIFWAQMLKKHGHSTVGLLIEQAYIGFNYADNFRRAASAEGITILAEETVSQTGQDVSEVIARIHRTGAEALVHCGFGLGHAGINAALDELGWDPPRYIGTAFETAFNEHLWDATRGWIGLEQYDEGNQVAQQFLDDYETAYGHRPAFYAPLLFRDLATVVLHGLAGAKPLSPRGVRESLEQLKMLPAACGSAGTRISFGRFMHRGWVGSRYLVARKLDADGKELGQYWKSTLVDRFGDE